LIGELAYGQGNYQMALEIGRQFLLMSEEKMLAVLKLAREAGLDFAMRIPEKMIDVSFGGSQGAQKRAKARATRASKSAD
jgi:hypothetical protein